ncbi:MAG: DNA-binding protein [Lewinella sp.]
MAQKIATASTVFAACDRLDAANERWNRDDVRHEVGGGGFVVIDPLIKAWRELKPLREAAPSTPTELLHQVAASLETHITGFIGETETRLTESQQVFDKTVSGLSERLAEQESDLTEQETSIVALTTELSNLTEQLEDSQESLNDVKTVNAQLMAESDGYRGQIARMESEHKEVTRSLAADMKEHAQEITLERKRLNAEHTSELTNQRKELVETAEQSESRLMVLLDQERLATKEAVTDLTAKLDASNDKVQEYREQGIKRDAAARQLGDQNRRLTEQLTGKETESAKLKAALEKEKTRGQALQREFEAYKDEHRMSGELAALQLAVTGLQQKLGEKQKK